MADMNGEAPKVKARKPYTITKQRERWTEEEHEKFVAALKLHGRAWRKIEEAVGTKTTVQIRSHAQKFFAKLEKQKDVNNTAEEQSINIPPPRPKRKPTQPYPRNGTHPLSNGGPSYSSLADCYNDDQEGGEDSDDEGDGPPRAKHARTGRHATTHSHTAMQYEHVGGSDPALDSQLPYAGSGGSDVAISQPGSGNRDTPGGVVLGYGGAPSAAAGLMVVDGGAGASALLAAGGLMTGAAGLGAGAALAAPQLLSRLPQLAQTGHTSMDVDVAGQALHRVASRLQNCLCNGGVHATCARPASDTTGAVAAGSGDRADTSQDSEVTDVAVAAVIAAASAAAATAALSVVAAAGPEIQARMQKSPPLGFPFYGYPPSMLGAMALAVPGLEAGQLPLLDVALNSHLLQPTVTDGSALTLEHVLRGMPLGLSHAATTTATKHTVAGDTSQTVAAPSTLTTADVVAPTQLPAAAAVAFGAVAPSRFLTGPAAAQLAADAAALHAASPAAAAAAPYVVTGSGTAGGVASVGKLPGVSTQATYAVPTGSHGTYALISAPTLSALIRAGVSTGTMTPTLLANTETGVVNRAGNDGSGGTGGSATGISGFTDGGGEDGRGRGRSGSESDRAEDPDSPCRGDSQQQLTRDAAAAITGGAARGRRGTPPRLPPAMRPGKGGGVVWTAAKKGGHINGVHTNGLVAHNGLHAPLNGFNGFSHGLPNGLNGQLLATNGLNGLTGWPNGLNGLLPTVLPNGLNGLSLPAMTTLDNNNLNQNGSDGTNGSSDGAGGVTGVHASNGTGSSDANQGNGSDNNNNNNGLGEGSSRMASTTLNSAATAATHHTHHTHHRHNGNNGTSSHHAAALPAEPELATIVLPNGLVLPPQPAKLDALVPAAITVANVAAAAAPSPVPWGLASRPLTVLGSGIIPTGAATASVLPGALPGATVLGTPDGAHLLIQTVDPAGLASASAAVVGVEHALPASLAAALPVALPAPASPLPAVWAADAAVAARGSPATAPVITSATAPLGMTTQRSLHDLLATVTNTTVPIDPTQIVAQAAAPTWIAPLDIPAPTLPPQTAAAAAASTLLGSLPVLPLSVAGVPPAEPAAPLAAAAALLSQPPRIVDAAAVGLPLASLAPQLTTLAPLSALTLPLVTHTHGITSPVAVAGLTSPRPLAQVLAAASMQASGSSGSPLPPPPLPLALQPTHLPALADGSNGVEFVRATSQTRFASGRTGSAGVPAPPPAAATQRDSSGRRGGSGSLARAVSPQENAGGGVGKSDAGAAGTSSGSAWFQSYDQGKDANTHHYHHHHHYATGAAGAGGDDLASAGKKRARPHASASRTGSRRGDADAPSARAAASVAPGTYVIAMAVDGEGGDMGLVGGGDDECAQQEFEAVMALQELHKPKNGSRLAIRSPAS